MPKRTGLNRVCKNENAVKRVWYQYGMNDLATRLNTGKAIIGDELS